MRHFGARMLLEEEGELSASEESEVEEGEVEDPVLPELSIYPPLAPGFMRVRRADGKDCYQHLLTKVVVWSRPYCMPHAQPFETHEVPHLIGRAVAAVRHTRGIKRPPPLPSAAAAASGRAAAAGRAAKKGGGHKEDPVRVFNAGCPMFDIDITGKTPVMVLNEFCPKVP